jgi:hypothetical protein
MSEAMQTFINHSIRLNPVKTCVNVYWAKASSSLPPCNFSSKRVLLPISHFCQISTETGIHPHSSKFTSMKLLDNSFNGSRAIHAYSQMYGQTNKRSTSSRAPLKSDEMS